jgi:hypothetical protein
MTKIAVCLGYPVVDDAWGNAGTATLRFCLDQRAKLSERHRHRRRSRLVVVRDGLVRSVGLEQALDQRGRTALRSVIKVKGVDRVAGSPGQHQAEGLAS